MSRRRLLAIWLLCELVFAAILAVRDAAGQTAPPGPIFRSGTELVLVNVVVRDRNGAPVRGHRLVVLFFDLSSMQEAEFNRAIDSARSFVTAKVSTADLVAIASFSTSLQVA